MKNPNLNKKAVLKVACIVAPLLAAAVAIPRVMRIRRQRNCF